VITRTRRSVRLALLAGLVTVAVACGSNPTGPTVVPSTSAPSASAAAGSPSPSTASIAPSASIVVPSASAEAGWTEVWPQPTDGAAHLTTATVTVGGFVVAGSDAAGTAPVAISSGDGAIWITETIPGGRRTPNALARWGERVLATGVGEAPCAHPYGLDTWVREATGTWTEAPFDPLLCDASSVEAATVGDVAVLAGSGPGDNPIVWSSPDGLRWTDHGDVFAGLLPGGVVGDGAQAWVLATGSGATWIAHTEDGVTWTPPERIHDIPEVEIRGTFLIGDHAVIVATVGGSVGTIDPGTGGGWVITPATGLQPEALASVSQFDGGLLATGTQPGGAALAWVSEDGIAWRSVALPGALASPDSSVAAVAVRGERAILVGSVVAGGGSAASRIWTGPASLVLP
jgi:hypothetical protein